MPISTYTKSTPVTFWKAPRMTPFKCMASVRIFKMHTHKSRSERALHSHVLESDFLGRSRSKTPFFCISKDVSKAWFETALCSHGLKSGFQIRKGPNHVLKRISKHDSSPCEHSHFYIPVHRMYVLLLTLLTWNVFVIDNYVIYTALVVILKNKFPTALNKKEWSFIWFYLVSIVSLNKVNKALKEKLTVSNRYWFNEATNFKIWTFYIKHNFIIWYTVRAEIFAVVLFSRISRVKPSRKFPLQFMSIYSNDNISKITKLTPHELPHLAKTTKITVGENNGVYSTLSKSIYLC